MVLFLVLFIKFLVQLRGSPLDPAQKGQEFIQILIISVVVLVIAVPEGLPLAVTLSLAYATVKMLKARNLVRVLRACETMGNATTICSDKTGTLTENKMTVVAAAFGHGIELESLEGLPLETRELIRMSVVANSTALEMEGKLVGSNTEVALLEMARRYLDVTDIDKERAAIAVIRHIPFNSERKFAGVIVDYQESPRLLVTGASELVLQCTTLAGDQQVNDTINSYATKGLRTIGFAYRDLKAQSSVEDEVFRDMTWLGVVGIKDPLRKGVAEAVRQCQEAGVVVRMVTGDNVLTARTIALECGILTDGIVMDGAEFRSLSDEEKRLKIPALRVLARSSPRDKYNLVKWLKEQGETVAVTGDGTNDAPALKASDVGFSMGLSGTEVAKEASDIILMDDDFSSIVNALLWGRCISDAIKKFLQVQTLGMRLISSNLR